MNRCGWTVALIGVLAGGMARADIITQTINYDFPFDGNPTLPFAGFDDQGGTLRLDKMTFDWDLNWSFDYRLENTGPTALNPGDFALVLEHYTIHQLGIGEAPGYGPGGTFFSREDIALPAYDGVPGGDGVFLGSFLDSYQRTLEFTAANDLVFLETMTQAGPIDTIYGGFGFLAFYWVNEPAGWDPPSGPDDQPIYPIDDAVWVALENTRHFGSVTLTYEYSAIPEPATVVVLGAMALLTVRRRNRRAGADA